MWRIYGLIVLVGLGCVTGSRAKARGRHYGLGHDMNSDYVIRKMQRDIAEVRDRSLRLLQVVKSARNITE